MTTQNRKINLQDIGLTSEQEAILNCIIEKGPTKIADLSKNISIKRTTMYLHLENLLEKGYVVKNIEGKNSIISLASRKSIQGIIAKNKEEIKKKNSVLETISLLAKNTNNDLPPTQLTGKEGFRELLDFIIKEKKDIYWFGSFEKIISILGDEEFFKLMTWRRMNGETTAYSITDRTILNYKRYSDQIGKFRQIRIIKDDLNVDAIFGSCGVYFAVIDLSNGINITLTKSAPSVNLFLLMFNSIKNNSQDIQKVA